jgi:hypothetical protein
LRNSLNDAKDVAAALQALGFTVTIGFDLTRRQMDEITARFSSSLHAGDLALFLTPPGMDFSSTRKTISFRSISKPPRAKSAVTASLLGRVSASRSRGSSRTKGSMTVKHHPLQEQARGGSLVNCEFDDSTIDRRTSATI